MFVDAPHSLASQRTASVVLGATDPGSSRLVYAMVIGLVLVGIALVVLGIWIVRQTRPDLEVLAPLERMGDRDWKKRDPATQRRMLDEVRPPGAEPMAAQAPPPPLDVEFEQSDHPVPSLSDLGPGVLADVGRSAESEADDAEADAAEAADAGSDDVDDDEPANDADTDDGAVELEPESELEAESEDETEPEDEIETEAEPEVDHEPEVHDETDAEIDDVVEADAEVERVTDDADEVHTAEEPAVDDGDERVDDVAADQR